MDVFDAAGESILFSPRAAFQEVVDDIKSLLEKIKEGYVEHAGRLYAQHSHPNEDVRRSSFIQVMSRDEFQALSPEKAQKLATEHVIATTGGSFIYPKLDRTAFKDMGINLHGSLTVNGKWAKCSLLIVTLSRQPNFTYRRHEPTHGHFSSTL